jgi:protein-S-isoprenylcysteine O-methyltransferase Ste14
MKKSLRSYIHVFIQFVTLIYLSFSGSFLGHPFWIFVEVFGVIIGVWSVWLMNRSVLSVYPEPNEGIKLIQSGPYKIIRHPMYASLFLVFVPMVIANASTINLIVLLVFTINQILKLLYEEQLLRKTTKGYSQYMQSTWRIIPFIF